jgi:hypothetical protein
MNMETPRPDGFYWLTRDGNRTVGQWQAGRWQFIGSLFLLDDAELAEADYSVGPPIGDPVEPGDIMVDRLAAVMVNNAGRYSQTDIERTIRLLDVPVFWRTAVAALGERVARVPDDHKATALRDAEAMQVVQIAAPVLFRLLEGAVK